MKGSHPSSLYNELLLHAIKKDWQMITREMIDIVDQTKLCSVHHQLVCSYFIAK